MKNIKKYILILLFLIYEELIFSFCSAKNISLNILVVLFSIQIALIGGCLLIFKNKKNKIILFLMALFTSIVYSVQFLYYKTFGVLLSINIIFNSMQIRQFSKEIITIISNNIFPLFLINFPLILYVLFIKKITIIKATYKEAFFSILLCLTLYAFTITFIKMDNSEKIYSLKNLYYNINNMNENLNNFGVITTVRLDLQRTIFKFEEKQLYKYEDNKGNITILNSEDYNMTNIDFEQLIKQEDNEIIKEIHNYVKYQEPTKKNQYTGMFEGKNLIVILGESFSSLAINKDLTPTLYKLATHGFKFNNFYTPLFPVSTADGQYLSDTSLIPAEGKYSIQEVTEKKFPYAYGNVFRNLNYKTYAFHNYKYDYYKRDVYFETFGYDSYLALGNGLEERMDFSNYPSSDYDMINSTINDYINEDKFLAYYVTMSGHLNYDLNHAIVRKNWDIVKDLNYTFKAKAYLATQIELDRAIEKMMKTLEENNKLKDTVIVLFGDHYPYGLSETEIRELSSRNMENYDFERFHMPFIIYNEGQDTIEINKLGSSLDILPTILNLFGIEYDSRLLMGKDILSDFEPLIIFSNRSFITTEGKYNSNTRNFISNNQKDYSEYLKSIQEEIYQKYRYSRLMLENNYYSYIKK